jgi:hypothetical protein
MRWANFHDALSITILQLGVSHEGATKTSK